MLRVTLRDFILEARGGYLYSNEIGPASRKNPGPCHTQTFYTVGLEISDIDIFRGGPVPENHITFENNITLVNKGDIFAKRGI